MAQQFKFKEPTLRDVLLYTYSSKFKNRFDYYKRDVLKRVQIQYVRQLKVDRPESVTKKFVVKSFSYPNYSPYLKKKSKWTKKGKEVPLSKKDKEKKTPRKQRTIKHEYDITLELVSLSLDSKFKIRIGRNLKNPYNVKIPDKEVKSISKKYRAKLEKKYGKGTPELKRVIAKHKKKAPYLDKGDYVSRALGINNEFIYRQMAVFYAFNCLFQKNFSTHLPKDKDIIFPFFGKHDLGLVLWLVKSGKITS